MTDVALKLPFPFLSRHFGFNHRLVSLRLKQTEPAPEGQSQLCTKHRGAAHCNAVAMSHWRCKECVHVSTAEKL